MECGVAGDEAQGLGFSSPRESQHHGMCECVNVHMYREGKLSIPVLSLKHAEDRCVKNVRMKQKQGWEVTTVKALGGTP